MCTFFIGFSRRLRRYQNAVKRVSRATAPLRSGPNRRRSGPGETRRAGGAPTRSRSSGPASRHFNAPPGPHRFAAFFGDPLKTNLLHCPPVNENNVASTHSCLAVGTKIKGTYYSGSVTAAGRRCCPVFRRVWRADLGKRCEIFCFFLKRTPTDAKPREHEALGTLRTEGTRHGPTGERELRPVRAAAAAKRERSRGDARRTTSCYRPFCGATWNLLPSSGVLSA